MTTELAISTTSGAKMMYLIKRKPGVSRDELIAHWFANHMPGVIDAQQRQGGLHATRYIATLFSEPPDRQNPWDGVAQLWFDQALPRPKQPHGTNPTDSFQQRAEPYIPWGTTEYVVIAGDERLTVAPLTLNRPFPTTRSGFHKITFLVKAKADVDYDAFFKHWLDVHVPNVAATMHRVAGVRYVVSHSIDPAAEPYAGMAELYFADSGGWENYKADIKPDGMEEFVANEGTLVLKSDTEMIGIP